VGNPDPSDGDVVGEGCAARCVVGLLMRTDGGKWGTQQRSQVCGGGWGPQAAVGGHTQEKAAGAWGGGHKRAWWWAQARRDG
jgi:hypothetical protein